MQIITGKIRQNAKLGDAKMVWHRIHQLKNNKTKPFGSSILKQDNTLAKSDGEVLNAMRNYNYLNFSQEKAKLI